MPLGNGDIGLNVWTEKNGDVCFYISKTDAWTEDNHSSYALPKLGRVRISYNNTPLTGDTPVLQSLHLRDGAIEISGGGGPNRLKLRIWVDANAPVVRVQSTSASPTSIKVVMETSRAEAIGPISADVILSDQKDQIRWYHSNAKSREPHLRDFIFGAAIKGDGLARVNATTLQSSTPTTAQVISIYPLTLHPGTVEQWQKELDAQIAGVDQTPLAQAWPAHQAWWHQFWNRSWINVSGDEAAMQTTQGYVLQRFVTACAGRGAYPIKFNGSIFTVDNPTLVQSNKNSGTVTVGVNADYRAWGGQYWFQNTRAMYWPRLMAGDYDMMLPLFRMYHDLLPADAAEVKQYYGHDGAYCAETAPFYGGLPDIPKDAHASTGSYTLAYFTPVLELSVMMLDYYEFTQDQAFVRQTLLPVALPGLTFFDQHFKRDDKGKLLLDPDNAIEMYWNVHDPAPDIAGLKAVTARLLELPPDLLSPAEQDFVKRVQAEIPDLPIGEKNGKPVLLPYTGEQTAKGHNSENPELYAIYPFRLYGLGKPDLQLARDTFNLRGIKATGCWVQDPIQSAYLGDTALARQDVHFDLTRKSKRLKFPAFWDPGHDYDPDEDNGGNGENGLQKMLMQTDGKKILLLPAWPREWNADFKLNAPYRTVVQGTVRAGKIQDLQVTPASRMGDVIVSSQ